MAAGERVIDVRKGVAEKQVITGKDYRRYRMGPKDMLVCVGKGVALSTAIAWLFYRSLWGMLVFPAVLFLMYRERKRAGIKEQQQALREQFKECIRSVTASMYSGYSVENAFVEAEKELVHLLGEEAVMCRELQFMNQQIRLNIPAEQLLQNLADRSGVEEIFGFGQVFGYAKRSGSDFARILKDTADRIAEKAELEKELQAMTAARRLEQKIMNVIPMGILFFVDITSPGFLQIMYSGSFGRTVMSILLLVYAGAWLLSGKIVDIRI